MWRLEHSCVLLGPSPVLLCRGQLPGHPQVHKTKGRSTCRVQQSSPSSAQTRSCHPGGGITPQLPAQNLQGLWPGSTAPFTPTPRVSAWSGPCGLGVTPVLAKTPQVLIWAKLN